PYGCFQMLGNLRINYQYPHQEAADNYQRKLSLNDAVASTSFTRGGITYNREYLASHSDDVLAIRVAADRRGAVSFELELSRPERATISVKGESLIMEGQLNDGHNGDKGVRYLTKVEIVNKGGTVSAGSKSLSLSNADEAIILIST